MEQTFVHARLSGKLVNVIMKLISSGSCRLVWNGEATDSIKLSRGLCQGDPLSLLHLCFVHKEAGALEMNEDRAG